MNIIRPNYNECITNLSNSILNYFDCKTFHNTLPCIDNILNSDYKNIILLLCDGLGSKLIESILDENSFLIQNKLKDITTVFPPTTTAATTSILSGKNPNEHGWLGWDLYFKKENRVITMFLNTFKDSNLLAANYNVAKETFPYENIIDIIGKKCESHGLFSFNDEKYKDFECLLDDIYKLSLKDNKKFIYAYYNNPDSLLHAYGTDSKEVKEEIKKIDNAIEELCSKLQNSLVIVTADHGHINSQRIVLDDYSILKSTLERETSIEPRAVSFKIKKGCELLFKSEFNKYFSNDFLLLSKEDIIKSKLFGFGENNHLFNDSIGDFLAVAINDKYIVDNKLSDNLKSMHAGLTDKEMLIPVIVKSK